MAGHNNVCERGLSYYHNPGSEPLKMLTIGELVDSAAEKWPQRSALISYENEILTYLDVKNKVDKLATSILGLGLKPGDRIGLLGINSVRWYITMLAANKAGLIIVMLNPAYRVKELEVAIKEVGVKGIFTDLKFKTQDYIGMLTEIVPSLSSATPGRPLNPPEMPELSFVIVGSEEKLPGCYRFEDVMNMETNMDSLAAVQKIVQPDDPAWIYYTSGSTGTPKAAVMSNFGVINHAITAGRRHNYHKMHKNICLQLPLFHIFGASAGILTGLVFGCTLIVPGPIFNKTFILEAIRKHKCQVLIGTPTMFIDICNELKSLLPNSANLQESCSHVEILLSGGSIFPGTLAKDVSYTFPNSTLMMLYGMTELSCGTVVTYMNDPLEKKLNTVGHVLEYLEVKVVDDQGRMVPFGTPGEAWFRGPGILLEYWGYKEKNIDTKTTAGWFKTGDIVSLTEDGYCSIKGRIKDIIIRGGENIYPAEIEEFLLQHPDIANAQVYGVADHRLGEEVAVSIKLKVSSILTESGLRDYFFGKISHFKIPRHVRFVTEYPTTASGKIKKYELRDIHEKELKNKKC